MIVYLINESVAENRFKSNSDQIHCVTNHICIFPSIAHKCNKSYGFDKPVL